MKRKTVFVALIVSIALIGSALPAYAKPKKGAGELPPPTASGVAEWLLDKALGTAASQGFNFVLHAIGLNKLLPVDNPNAEALEALKRDINALSQKIDGVTANLDSLTTDVRNAALRDDLRDVSRESDKVKDLWDHYFTPLVDQAISISLEKDAGEAAEKRDELVHMRNLFYKQFDTVIGGTIPSTIHKYLVPKSGLSILRSKGSLLLAQKRYLTAADSAEIRALYNTLAEHEALASWMYIERWTPSDPPPPRDLLVAAGNEKAFNDARQQFLDFTADEHRNLPPTIPADVVIDAGPTPRTTTNNGRMWTPAANGDLLRARPGVDADAPGTVPGAIFALNSEARGGFNDWTVPFQSNITDLYTRTNGFTSGTSATLASFLTAMNPTSAAWKQISQGQGQWPFIWSSDWVAQTMACIGGPAPLAFSIQAYQGITTSANPVGGSHPAFQVFFNIPKNQLTTTYCEPYINEQFATAPGAGGFLATRPVGTRAMDYMAQGNGPNIAKDADLRGLNLSGLTLHELDLGAANLTGANLDGAELQGAKLAGANLTDVHATGVQGDPASLPAGWRIVGGVLVGPNADLRNTNLDGLNLSTATLTGVRSGKTTCVGCQLPANWTATGGSGGYLLGPSARIPGANLAGLKFPGVNLSGANLWGADLSGADFAGANFTSANLRYTDLRRGNFTNAVFAVTSGFGADAANAIFAGGNLQRSTFNGGNFNGADLSRTNLTSGSFENANMSGADMTSIVFNATNLNNADLTGTTLRGVWSSSIGGTPKLPTGWRLVNGGVLIGPQALVNGLNLSDANLSGMNLVGIDFSNTILFNFNFTNANLTGANFTVGRLFNANFTNATLNNAVFGGTMFSRTTFATNDESKLAGVRIGVVPSEWRGLTLPASGRYRLVEGWVVGPNTNVSGAVFPPGSQLGTALTSTNFTGATLAGINFANANMTRANLTNARLTNAYLGGTDLAAATLNGVVSGGVSGTPLLPSPWRLIQGYLVGPGAILQNANLRNANLYLADFTGADITGADFFAAIWNQTTCPDGIRYASRPCVPLPVSDKPLTVSLTADERRNHLNVDIGPDLGDENYAFLVERLSGTGWIPVAAYVTANNKETMTIEVDEGTYRVLVPSQFGHVQAISAAVSTTT